MKCHICLALRRWLFVPLCGPMLFNRDMSLEVGRLTAEVERLREQCGGEA